ncbi:type 3 dihydrofolate reductase [Bacillus altitudinis MN12]|uniref:type 3 dihydrofolate reductase n=1 Tax=Bacillus altitudinis TaxID=293387 RepID=UPI001B83605B|nr:type 3 dihydrofolate reductase [Bacillus altitudinis]MBR0583177.1 type 3 dihydrofolate reductase [Bacillus altitudinis MN12]MBR0592647.1 type 3 dihydrofolate reductase [Bacillus altitudinis C16B11]MBR0610593.1 type 3 dihydrofolate reductase [Bacillus altitudinis]
MISMIVATGKDRVIGKDNQMPWHLPADLAYFKKVTSGHTIVMGRKTFESIGRALPNRRNIVLTTSSSFQAEGCEVVHSIDDILTIAKTEEELLIIGGSKLYEEMMLYADRLYITHIHHSFEGDRFFPYYDEDDWTVVSREKGHRDEKNPYNYEFVVYDRKEG